MSTGLIACADMNKEDVGTISGAVAGGLIGSTIGGGSGKVAAIGLGAMAGAVLGGSIGKSMDELDRIKAQQALESNAIGQPAYWTNKKSGTQYKVVPVKNVAYRGNRYCREYTTQATIAGKTQQVYGTACRRPDGTWKIVK